MTLHHPLSEEQICQTASHITKNRPSYGPLIEFYSKVFLAQEKSLSAISFDPILIEPKLLAMKQENEMPLISPEEFFLDVDQARQLLLTICDLACAHAPKLSESGKIIGRLIAEEQLDPTKLFPLVLENQGLAKTAAKIGIPTDALSFFLTSAITPSLQACATQLATYLGGKEDKKGYCPICGSVPASAVFDKNGNRHLLCSLCLYQWRTQRMGCVFCDTQDLKSQQYFFSKEEKEYRVYVCKICKNYLKTIDLRELNRAFYPKLEMVTTLHLDIKAREQGYTNTSTGPALDS